MVVKGNIDVDMMQAEDFEDSEDDFRFVSNNGKFAVRNVSKKSRKTKIMCSACGRGRETPMNSVVIGIYIEDHFQIDGCTGPISQVKRFVNDVSEIPRVEILPGDRDYVQPSFDDRFFGGFDRNETGEGYYHDYSDGRNGRSVRNVSYRKTVSYKNVEEIDIAELESV